MRMHPRQVTKQALLLWTLFLALLSLPAMAAGEAPTTKELQLEVKINGQPVNLVSKFIDLGGGRLASPASELRELGIKGAEGASDEELIPLERIGGLTYVYDEPHQTIEIQIGDEHRAAKVYDARGENERPKVTPSHYGAVLDYDVFAAGGTGLSFDPRYANFDGVNATLDARLISPGGVLTQTGIVGSTFIDESNTLRLESTYTFSDDENLVSWRAGDVYSGGLAWNRPIRLGGGQVQRSFGMRPDLVTTALPAFSGSAAVPSAVDVFINGVKSYSQDVIAGPYQISNIPTISGAGVAQVVTRDASGKESVQTLSFYTSPRLLRPGLYDFSVETGFARQAYGVLSNEYDTKLLGSATLRTGIADWLTAEGHAEAGGGLFNAGLGINARVLDRGVVSVAAAGSSSDRGTGYQLYGSFETRIGPVSITGRAQHTFEKYDDLASVAAENDPTVLGRIQLPGIGWHGAVPSFLPPKAIDSLTLSMPIEDDHSSVSATILNYQPATGTSSQIVTASYSRPLIADATMYASGYMDVRDPKTAGLYLGVNVPLGNKISLSSGLDVRNNSTSGYVDATKPLEPDVGSWGWRIRDYEGDATYRTAAVSHRTSSARMEATVFQDRSGVRATGEVDGAIALIGGDMYFSNHIDDAFALVDAHEPGVKILRENVAIGVTGEDGKLLIPNLSSYQKNKISIDPTDLPLDAEIKSTVDYVTPQFKSGLYVEFEVTKSKPSGIVILKGADGKYLPAGSEVTLDGVDEHYIVGYEGQAYLKGLMAVNTIHVQTDSGTCSAQFAFEKTGNAQPIISTEVCQ